MPPRTPTPVLAGLALVAALICGPCAADGETGPADAGPRVGEPARPDPRADVPTSAGADDPGPGAFWTKHAYFVPSRFRDLPGWLDDNLTDAWKAFRQTCSALSRRTVWAGPCSRSAAMSARNDDEVRRFLEREFTLYEIRNKDRSSSGVITGYYEPLLNGSPRYDPRYPYPVYGVPNDLLFLDARSIPAAANGAPIRARVDGRNAIPVCFEQAAGASCTAPYRLDLGDAKPDIRDRRLRVRTDGNRIVPYYTRAEIERGALRAADVIVWVDNFATLYSMQVQGSGKVRMPDGAYVRLAFAEQNGHPFLPPVRIARTRGLGEPAVLLTRGIPIPLSADDGDAPAPEIADTAMRREPVTRGLQPWGDPQPVASPSAGTGDEDLTPEVARMVELLLKGTGAAGPQRITAGANPGAPPRNDRPIRVEPAANNAGPVQGSEAKAPLAQRPTLFSSDPSFVFFRQIPDSESGPLGALGVPLTPGRSVAVDPRTTPLGSPVFISTDSSPVGSRLNRLMLAQDTGGAIRGPVRADYFWGFGPRAGDMASRMKENGRMWLLLPRDLDLAARAAGLPTRGLGGAADASEAECLVPDPELCVE